jgi:trigger factor
MTLDASRLQVSVQEHERWRRKMSVTVPAAVVREEEQRAARQLASRASLKGFRKGRVPAKMIESRFAGALRKEALDKLIGDAYRHALEAEKLRPISEGEIEEVRYEPEQDLTFQVAFDIQPVIQVGRLGGFAVERPAARVEEEQIDAVLTRIREQNGAWRPVPEGSPQDGDLVGVKLLRLDEPDAETREYDFVLGQGDALPQIEGAIRSLEPGKESDFEITFPADFSDEGRRGATEQMRIALTSRRTLDLPPLDDSLAKQVGDFETLEQLKTRIREDLQKEAEQRAESTVRSRLLDLLLEANTFEVPSSMVDRYVEGFLGDPKDVPADKLAEVRGQIRPEAERADKPLLLIDHIAESQSLTATDIELDPRNEEIAAANDTTPAKVYASLQKSGRLDSLERELTEKKVFQFLTEQSEIT